ncbi:MAG: ATP-binding cassette domain-containing protein [Candidatus Krumholzibacteria bacterium]
MIDLQDISVSLPPGQDPGTLVLKNVSLHVSKGDWIALVGPNGSGKTTLLKTVAGLLPVCGGTISDDCEARTQLQPAARPSVGLLLQEPDNQFVASSVRSELLLSVPVDVGDESVQARIREATERFSLNGFLDRNPHRLSGGEKQRLAMATVWLADPDVLLLDEPVSYLDRRGRERCVEFVKELNQSGVAVLWATPGGEDIQPSSRVVYLEAGEVRFEGSTADFRAEAERRSLSGTGVDDAVWESTLPANWTAPSARVGGPPVGTTGEKERATSRRADAQRVLSLRNVSFAYDTAKVLEDISLEVRAGECVGITGPNGSGKSTLLSLMSGVLRPTGGTIERDSKPRRERNRQDVFHLFQSPERLFFAETVFEEIAYGLRSLGVPRSDIPDRVAEALSRAGLEPKKFLNRLPFSLSFGEMRRLAFAIAAALDPRLLILDEPASCLDAAGRRILYRMTEGALEAGRAVVIASHDVNTLAPVAGHYLEL